MVQVTQTVQTDPGQSYLGLSKPISPFEGDKSKGLELAGIGNILENAVSSADMLVKQKISMDVHSGVDQRRDAELNALSTLRDAATGTPGATDPNSKTQDLFASGKHLSYMDNPGTDGQPPAALQGISSLASNLKAALVGGHIPLTYYRQQMDSFAKDVRSMYGPGYRGYVDEQFKQAGAGDTANEYMQALVSDLQHLGKERPEHERLAKHLEEAAAKGVEGSNEILEGWKRKLPGFDDDNAYRKLNLLNREHYNMEMNKERFQAFENGTKLEAYNAEQDINKKAFNTSAIHFSSVLSTVGINSTADLDKKVSEARANPGMYTSQQYEGWAQMTLANRKTAYDNLWAEANKPFGKDNRSYVDRLGNGGAETARKLINGQLGAFDEVYNAFKSKDFGLAMNTAQQLQHILEKTEYDGLTDKDAGPILKILHNSNKYGGPAVAGIVMSQVAGNGGLEKFKQYMSKEMIRATTPADNPDGSKKTLNDVMKEIHGPASSINDTELPKAFINHVTNISNKDLPDPAKVELVKWAFDPANRGSLNNIAPDRYDERTGQTIKGQAWMFQTMTNPKNIAEIKRLDAAYPGQGLWKNTKDWALESFAFHQLPTELKTINENIDSGVGMKWTNGHIVLDERPQSKALARAGFRGVNNSAQSSVQRINDSLDNIKNVFAAENPDPKAVDAYLIRTLNQLGVDPNRKVTSGPQLPAKEIVDKMWSAVASTAKSAVDSAKKTIGNPNPKLGHPIADPLADIPHYVDEAQKGNLADWLRNPTRGTSKPLHEHTADDLRMELQRREAIKGGVLNRSSTVPREEANNE